MQNCKINRLPSSRNDKQKKNNKYYNLFIFLIIDISIFSEQIYRHIDISIIDVSWLENFLPSLLLRPW